MENHLGSDKQFGYKFFNDYEEYNKAIKNLYLEEIIPSIDKGLSVAIYTQVSDIEDEVNGFLTYDRKVLKADINKFKEFNKKIKYFT